MLFLTHLITLSLTYGLHCKFNAFICDNQIFSSIFEKNINADSAALNDSEIVRRNSLKLPDSAHLKREILSLIFNFFLRNEYQHD